jgi:hypothetical protein
LFLHLDSIHLLARLGLDGLHQLALLALFWKTCGDVCDVLYGVHGLVVHSKLLDGDLKIIMSKGLVILQFLPEIVFQMIPRHLPSLHRLIFY